VKAYISPSRTGVKLKINVKCSVEENIKERALLWDDPYRLRYSLKRWALGSDSVDICFDEKDNMEIGEEITGKLREVYEKLSVNPSIEEIDEKAEELRGLIEEKLARKAYGCILFNEDNVKEKLEEICEEIASRDETFKWSIHLSLHPKWKWKLVVQAGSRDQAWKRIVWLKNRTALRKVKTEIWVKEV